MKYSNEKLKQKAVELGLELRVTRPVDNIEGLKKYIEKNYHASMTWLADKPEEYVAKRSFCFSFFNELS